MTTKEVRNKNPRKLLELEELLGILCPFPPSIKMEPEVQKCQESETHHPLLTDPLPILRRPVVSPIHPVWKYSACELLFHSLFAK